VPKAPVGQGAGSSRYGTLAHRAGLKATQLVRRLLIAVDERLRTLEVRSSGSSSREAAAGQASPPP
jgi:hypothetical protein